MVTRRVQLFGSLCGMVFLVNLGRLVFAPLVEPLRAAFGLSAGFVGLVVTLAWLGSAASRLPTGYALTYVPRHWAILAAGGVLTASTAVMSLAATPEALAASAFLVGLASGAYFIAANPLVSELFPSRVGRMLGVHGTAAQLAAVSAPLLVSGILVVATWRRVFEVIAVVAALVTAAFFLFARRSELPDAGSEDRDFLLAIRNQWPLIATGVAVVGVTGFVWNGVFNFYVTYLVEARGLGEGTARNVLTAVFAAGVPAFLVMGNLADRVPHVPLLLGVMGAFVASLLALTATSGLVSIVAVSLVLGYVIHGLFPVLDAYLLGSMPDDNRASAYATYSATVAIVHAGGSVSVGTATDAGIGFDALFRGLALVVAAVALGMWALYRLGRLPATER